MNQAFFRQLLAAGPLLLDGATGTHLQAAGMPAGVCPETWVLEHPAVLQDLQRAYYDAGSQIVYAFTFGANRAKLSHYHLDGTDVTALNQRLAALSIAVRDENRKAWPDRPVFVAGDLAPTGRFLYPAGDLTLGELVDIFREQVRGLLAAGVDLFVAETMLDMAEARAAVLAVRAECDLPVMVSLTMEANGRTLSGNSLTEGLLTMVSLGASAFGVNCSFGPEKLGSLIQPLLAISPVPLLLKPNAGLPCVVDGRTVFPMDAAAFAAAMTRLVHSPVRLIGGCCGTGPDHIRQLGLALTADIQPSQAGQPIQSDLPRLICSARETWPVDDLSRCPVVEVNDPDSLLDDVLTAAEDEPPAICLDLDNAADAAAVPQLLETLQQLQVMIRMPLIFRSEDTALIQQLVDHYNGRPGIITSQANRPNGPLYL